MSPSLQQRLEFRFPARDPHAGIPLSNATFGALLWGEGRTLRLTLNRADYWSHHGGLEFSAEATYENLKRWILEGDEARVRQVFEGRGPDGEAPPRPTRLPMGRVDLDLPIDWSLASGGLHLRTGEAELELAGYRDQAKLRAVLLREVPVLCLRITGLEGAAIKVLSRPPDTAEVRDAFREWGMPAPEVFDVGEFGGWVQERPGEPAMCVGWLRHAANGGFLLFVTSAYGDTPAEARANALQSLEAVRAEGYTPASLRCFSWWRKWWDQAAAVSLPEPSLELLYYLGMYRLGGLSVPGSPAATLQGPWVEEHRLPAWGSDHHFNVNVQESYWPCFAGNHVEALEPLVEMLHACEPRLRENAARFVGVRDGLHLPHATDDRGVGMSGFWTGFTDPGCMAWTAHLLWQRYRYTLDRTFLARVAYPFLKGSLRVYEAMLESDARGYRLPVSVSPEFGSADFNAWGRNASYQLALIHFLCRALCQASEELGIDAGDRERWQEIDRRLPLGAIGPGPELLIWEDQPLTESHRHHSHLAGLYPLDVLDYHGDEMQRRLVLNSMRRLTNAGMGRWTGWCFPWAAILHARLGNGEMSALLLETFRRAFMGPGYASTHDACFPGLTLLDARPDVMQLEAALGASAAVLEMLLHTTGGVLRVFPGVPPSWREVSFRSIRAEGAFLISADREAGRTVRIQVQSEAGATLRLAHPFEGAAIIIRREGAPPARTQARILELETTPGETLVLERG